MVKVSIIIPCMDLMGRGLAKCLDSCSKLSNQNFEVIVLPDYDEKIELKGCRVVPTGKIRPAEKRNLGAKLAKGKYLAFIDDDAFPRFDWIDNALDAFKDDLMGVVGGPNLTPKEDNFWSKCGGDVLASWLTGTSSLRYKIGKKPRKVWELPTCNLFVRKDLFDRVGGFDITLLTAEDSKLCFDIINLGKEVWYLPNIVVFHHRRELFRSHAKQMWIYGRDIAWLLKEQFSFEKVYYGILSLFVLFVFFGLILSIFIDYFRLIYLCFLLIYLFVVLFSSMIFKVDRIICVFFGLILTHFSYGLGFLYGLIRRRHSTLYGQMW